MADALATKTTTLWSLDVVKAALGEALESPAKDDAIVRLADGLSALIERETRWHFVTRSIVEIRDGDGTHRLYLWKQPLASITSVTIRRYPSDAAPEAIPATSYRFNLSGLLDLWADRLTPGVGNVTVTYAIGYGAQDAATLPQDIYQAGLDLVKHVWDQAKAGGLAAQTVTMANGGSFVPRERWPLHVQNAIDGWKRVGW